MNLTAKDKRDQSHRKNTKAKRFHGRRVRQLQAK